MAIDLHHIINSIAFALLHSLWEVPVLGLFAALSFTLMKSAPAWLRHSFGLAWLLAMLAVPIITCIGYFQRWPALAGGAMPLTALTGSAPAASLGALVPSWTDWVMPGVAFLWLVGVMAMLALRLGGLQFLGNIDRAGHSTLPVEWAARVDQLRASFGIARTVAVRVNTRIATPFTAYVLRPVIWLPLGLLTKLPADQLAALLAHELAHVRRLDWIWNLTQHCVESMLFYHPAMWWLSQRVREERELACDALAVQVCGDPLVLAEALANATRHARASQLPERPRFQSVGLGLAAQGGALHGRIAYLLRNARTPAEKSYLGTAGLLFLTVCLCGALAAAARMPHALLVNLQTRESTSGPLGAGDFREFSATYLFDPQRYYRLDIDHQGKRLEVYREDGAARPIDGRVQQWVAAMSAMHGGASKPTHGK